MLASLKRTQIYLEIGHDAALERLAEGSGRTKSDLIREAIDRYLASGDVEAERLRRFRETIGAVAGAAPHLPDGATYVRDLRGADRRRRRELDRRRA